MGPPGRMYALYIVAILNFYSRNKERERHGEGGSRLMRKAGMKIEIREKRAQVDKAKTKGEICSEEVTQAKQTFKEKVINRHLPL